MTDANAPESQGKYTDEDVKDQTTSGSQGSERPAGEYTDIETVDEAQSDGTHTHTETERRVNGDGVSQSESDDGQIHDRLSHDRLSNDGVGDGELDLEDRTERHD